MERTIEFKEHERMVIKLQDVWVITFALLVVFMPNAFRSIFLFGYIGVLSLRSVRECTIAIFVFMLCMLLQGMLPAYFYALGLLLFFTLFQAMKLMQMNLYRYLPYLSAGLVLLYSFMEFMFDQKIFVLAIAVFVYLKQLMQDTRWVHQDEQFFIKMKTMILFMTVFVAVHVFDIHADFWYLMMLSLICGYAQMELALIVVILFAVFLSDIPHAFYLAMAICVVYQKQKQIMLFSLLAFLWFISWTWEMVVAITTLVLIMLFKTHKQTSIQEVRNLSCSAIIKRQINNYAGIFQLLADYYASISDIESELLFTMAQALQYQADLLVNKQDMETKQETIKQVLEEYRYRVHTIQMEEELQGQLHMELELGGMHKKEVALTILPLLENLTHQKLQVASLARHRFLPKTYRMQITNQSAFTLNIACDSLTNAYTGNGDSHSVFRFRQSLVCMISDGMGNGERALQSSRLITSIFQRMVTSGISQNNAIRCINKLVQSDTFATLDVLCFHESEQKLYISKSAACPTYLIRGGKLQEISGSALPIGIVTQMQPDCFCLEYLLHDEFLMVSDGISRREVETWLSERSDLDVQAQAAQLREVLCKNKRFDDSTFIFIRVEK